MATRAALRASLSLSPFAWAATAMLTASRLTSQSKEPGSVSSKSFMSNIRVRSAEANIPKLARCASPHSWTSRPLRGTLLRSDAMTAAAPRRNAKGLSAIRA